MNLGEGTILNNRYQILRVLSDKGGMGLIYLANDLELDSKVVIKQSIVSSVESLRRDKNYRDRPEEELRDLVETSRKAFEREAKLLSGLRHNALPRVIGYVATLEGDQFLAMEFIPGKDLGELLDNRLRQNQGPFPLDEVLRWADQVLDALHYLHTEFDEPIIHRDIKPQNLKLMPNGQIILLDFGLAKGARPGMSLVQSVWGGTPEYSPLEQIDEVENEKQKSAPCSDLYSLALTLHHLLSGQKPPRTISRINAKVQNRPDPLRPLSEVASQVPQTVSSVLQQAAAVYANDRLATAAEMRQLLRQAVTSAHSSRVVLPEPELPTIVRPRRSITISLLPENESVKPVAEVRLLYPQSFIENLGNGVKLEMVYIPGGSFLIGSHYGKYYDEKYPQHRVTLATFCIGKYPITQVQWLTMMNINPCHFTGSDLPVENLTWDEAVMFCDMVSKRTGKTYRLPTEFEWEYACRAGSNGEYYFGDDKSLLREYAWYEVNSNGMPHAVGQKKPNDWGLFDMHGNVHEWCEYDDGLQDEFLVPHGGGWCNSAGVCAVTFRTGLAKQRRLNFVGFRLVRT